VDAERGRAPAAAGQDDVHVRPRRDRRRDERPAERGHARHGPDDHRHDAGGDVADALDRCERPRVVWSDAEVAGCGGLYDEEAEADRGDGDAGDPAAAYLDFRAHPATYEAMFLMPTGLRFAAADVSAPMRVAFTAPVAPSVSRTTSSKECVS
jgi:hypothetical protein